MKDSFKPEQRSFELLAIYNHDGDVNPHKPNAFNGPPRKELEDDWDKLMKSKILEENAPGLLKGWY